MLIDDDVIPLQICCIYTVEYHLLSISTPIATADLLLTTSILQICEPVRKLRKCRYFRDVTWTSIVHPDNTSSQVVVNTGSSLVNNLITGPSLVNNLNTDP